MTKNLKIVVKIALSAVLLGVVLSWIDASSMTGMIRRADPFYVMLSWLFGMPVMILSGLRWRMICAVLRIHLTRLQAVLSYMEGIAFNLVLPGAIGGDILRVVRLRAGQAGLQRGIASVIFDRIANLLILGILAVIVVPFVSGFEFVWVWVVAVLAALLTAYGTKLVFLRLKRGRRTKSGRVMASAMAQFMRVYMKRENLAGVLAWSVLAQVFAVLMVWTAVCAVGLSGVGIGAVVLTTAVVLLAASVPFTYGGLGLREASMIGMLQMFGADIDHAASAAFLFTGVIFLQAIPGLLVWFFKAVRAG